MKYFLDFAKLPKDRELLEDINSAAQRLHEKLQKVDVMKLPISDYNKRYLGSKFIDLTSSLQKYSYVLAWSLAESTKPKDDFVFLDYGGGSGVMSLLAKEYGIGTVIFNDIFETSCEDSMKLSEFIGVDVNHFVPGDVEDLIKFLNEKKINCDTVASYDVIEHVYDIEYFLKKLPLLSEGPLSIVMASGANQYNPMARRTEMKKQRKVEHEDRKKVWGSKERDCLESYLKVRKSMIKEYVRKMGKSVSEEDINILAQNTRGLIEDDIKKRVDVYFKSGEFPPEPDHPTNTCDPTNGNWAEHLMNPFHLAGILSKEGFSTRVMSGYYSSPKALYKRIIGYFLNLFIRLFGRCGLVLAPFYTIYGRRD